MNSKDVVGSLLHANKIGTKALCSYLSVAHQTVENVMLKTFASMHKKKKTKSQVVQVKDNLTNEIAMLKRIILARESQFDIGPQVIQEFVSHGILPNPPALAEIDNETGGFKLHGGNKVAMSDYMKKRLDVPAWSEGLPENELNLDTGYVIDLMGFIRTKMPQPSEVAKSFAERVLTTIIGNRPVDCCEIHIVADRYDGMLWIC